MIIHTSENAISKLPHVQLDSSFPVRDIVHMILAGGPSQTLYSLSRGVHQRAVDFLCREAESAIVEDNLGRPVFAMDQETRPHECLGMLAVAGVHFARTGILTAAGNDGTLMDIAETAMKTFDQHNAETSWSIMAFAVHPGVTAEWHNENGELQSVEKILKASCALPYGKGSCFGTHNLEGIAFAIRRFCLEQDIEPSQLSGTWLEAFDYIRGALQLMRKNQRDDGSLQRSWFRYRALPASSRTLREMLSEWASFREKDASLVYGTGHCLDAISSLGEFLPDEQEWIQQACYILAQTIETHWTNVGKHIGPLTHAIHALKLLDV